LTKVAGARKTNGIKSEPENDALGVFGSSGLCCGPVLTSQKYVDIEVTTHKGLQSEHRRPPVFLRRRIPVRSNQ
jgi:hypothetical protein